MHTNNARLKSLHDEVIFDIDEYFDDWEPSTGTLV